MRLDNFSAAFLGAFVATSVCAQQKFPEREAFFGQTHVHTSWSLDAYIIGNTITGPDDSLKFAMGQAIKHPAGYMVKLSRPLDFQGVTDHSEYVGVMTLANTPGSALSKLPIAQRLKVKDPADIPKIFSWLAGTIATKEPVKELVDPVVAGSVWKQNVAIADKYNKPGVFTAFCSYEWTSMPNNQNMHRNVFFKDCSKVPPVPFSAIDSDDPTDLWNWMDGQRRAGNEVLAISHNANLSNGLMFPVDVDSKGRPIDAAWAQQRMLNEPLTEIRQVKGTSETHPGLSPTDEFAGYEIMSYLIGIENSFSKLYGSYIREAWQNGLAMQDTRSYNPYKLGVVGAGDAHNTATAYTHSNYFGDHALVDGTPEARLAGKVFSGMDILKTGPSGLAGLWAEENTRESLFAAMQRKEVFGTSGVRIRVRLFGGWDFDPRTLTQKDWVKTGYAKGVPMGGDLPAATSKAPSFLVWAIKDPEDGALDRIQIIKGWTKSGQIFEKIFDVAWSGKRKPDPITGKVPAIASTVNISNASYTNANGVSELKTMWTDPEFDPSLHAFYYARVLQVPTPRWSTYDAKKLGIVPPSDAPATVQERAWTTPIWYTPSGEASRAAARSPTVASLTQKGAVALNDVQLKDLIVGKTVKVRNAVTGQRFDVLYGADGKRVISEMNGKAPSPGEMFEQMHPGISGSSDSYVIRGGRIVTTIESSPFELTVYKVGDKYVAARSNEYGFANYEVEAIK